MDSEDIIGELKRIKSFWSSQKDIYKLKYPHLMIKKSVKGGKVGFINKYDLTLYSVLLSKKENTTFFLVPIDDTLSLRRIEFQTRTPEERAYWFKALTKSIKVNELMQPQFISQSVLMTERESVNNFMQESDGMTLTEIASYLI